uniref:ATP synthase complex subunit 8 n=1 Tax=Cephalothrix sp. BMK-2020 TaxID=2741703 RepID=A0A6M8TTF5_9BILA|nr:ATP synthase F0 subunit 8 [Cephalothrix sp. BMK-2020]
MPQLAPIDWVLLFCFFWFILFLVFVSIWWINYNYFGFDSYKKSFFIDNVWMW